jgi:hypothetical protein
MNLSFLHYFHFNLFTVTTVLLQRCTSLYQVQDKNFQNSRCGTASPCHHVSCHGEKTVVVTAIAELERPRGS